MDALRPKNPRTWVYCSYIFDWIFCVILLVLFFLLDRVEPFHREFSVENKAIMFPLESKERIPVWALVLIAVVFPIVMIFVVGLGVRRCPYDLHNGILGLLVAILLTTMFTQVIKVKGMAILIAISRVQDYRHAGIDVTWGAIIGIIFAVFAYLQYYPSLISARSHVPHPPRDFSHLIQNQQGRTEESGHLENTVGIRRNDSFVDESGQTGSGLAPLEGEEDPKSRHLQPLLSKSDAPPAHISKSALQSWIFLLSFLALLALFAYHRHYTLPTPVLEGRNSKTGQVQFSEANVRKLTEYLSEDIGLRLVGTETVDETERYLLREIKTLQEQAKVEAARSHVVMKMYTNMTNIIVRLSCGPECDQNAILLNAHYDTTLGSPGATDDALSVGVQMELIRVLSQQPALKKNSVIFLFNGGEESLQDASHSFITNHELKDTVRAVINLEGCGTTGPEILFQANSRPMIDAYRKVPYPHGTVVANDLFATGIILSDTDFRQFVDHGNLTGLDMAVYTNSYLYHTHLDLNRHMSIGLPQHMGENTLALVKYLGDHVDLVEAGGKMFEKTSSVVFYDVLGYFFVSYSLNTAVVSHLMIGALALFALSTGASKPTARSLFSVLLSAVAALVAPQLVAVILVSVLKKPMQWFTHEWLPLLIFGPTSLAGMFLVQYVFHENDRTSSETGLGPSMEQKTLSAVQFFFSVLMGSATYAGLASSYILAIYAFSYSFGMIYNQKRLIDVAQQTRPVMGDNKQRRQEIAASVDYSTYLVMALGPSTYFFYAAYSLLDIMVPLTGRTGVDAPVDNMVAVVAGLFMFGAFPPILAFSHRFGQGTLRRILVGLVLAQWVILAGSVSLLQPYDKMHPKRIFAQHLRNLTSGETHVYVAHADPGPFYDNYVQDLETLFNTTARFKSGGQNPGDWNAIYPFSQFVDSFVLDTTPYIRSQTSNKTIAMSTAPLTELVHDAPKLTAEGVSYDPLTGLRKVTILCTHPDYIMTVINFDARLTSWSLSSAIPSKEKFHYVIRNAGGFRTDGWRLDLVYQASGPEDMLRVEMTSMETEGFDSRLEKLERELKGSGEVGVVKKLVKATPDFVALTYFSTVASAFDL
ncbi:hypothetical protein EDD11_003748 [Mortierella claussenii]|nr:hypothetical protein EDD11_003748 [Mortierella claussenii]